MDARELARWLRIVSSNRLVNPDPVTWSNTGHGGYCFSLDFCTDAEVLAGRCEVLTLPAARSGACPLFVELCAGLASVSLVLQGGRHARPPVSRMGNKRGYAEAILWACGLRQGQGARRFLWCEPDPGCSALLRAYGQPEVLREAADIIRGWADEDPRELWERLKAEGPIRGGEAGEVARWGCVEGWALGGQWRGPGANEHGRGNITGEGIACRLDTAPTFPAITVAPDARAIDPWTVAESLHVRPEAPGPHRADRAPSDTMLCSECCAALFAAPNVEHGLTGQLRTWVPLATLGRAVGSLVGDVLRLRTPCEICRRVVVPAAVEVTDHVSAWPRAVERSAHQRSHAPIYPLSPRAEDELPIAILVDAAFEGPAGIHGPDLSSLRNFVLGRLGDLNPHHDATLPYKGARMLPEGTVTFADPPYVGTSGYGHDLPREAVVEMARRWKDAGALVCISEQEALPELMAEGWHALDITSTRKGQKRTFSKQQTEMLTMSEPPRWRPAVQVGLFG